MSWRPVRKLVGIANVFLGTNVVDIAEYDLEIYEENPEDHQQHGANWTPGAQKIEDAIAQQFIATLTDPAAKASCKVQPFKNAEVKAIASGKKRRASESAQVEAVKSMSTVRTFQRSIHPLGHSVAKLSLCSSPFFECQKTVPCSFT